MDAKTDCYLPKVHSHGVRIADVVCKHFLSRRLTRILPQRDCGKTDISYVCTYDQGLCISSLCYLELRNRSCQLKVVN